MIVHKKIKVGSKVIDSPSYIVPLELENKIIIKPQKAKQKVEAVEASQ